MIVIVTEDPMGKKYFNFFLNTHKILRTKNLAERALPNPLYKGRNGLYWSIFQFFVCKGGIWSN